MTKHIHHWMLPSPDGPKVTGKCECGKKKRFPTAMDTMTRTEYRFNRPLDDEYATGVDRMGREVRERSYDERQRGQWR